MDWQGVDRGRAVRAGAAFLVLATPLFIASPVPTVLGFAGIGVAIAVVRITVGAYRRWADDHFPRHYAEHESGLVRFLAKLATGYGSYLVGFYTVVALLGIITLIGHFA